MASFTIRLSSGDRPVFAPENAVNAPVEVMAEPVSYTKASSYSVATDGLAICMKVLVLHKRGKGRYHSGKGGGSTTYNGDAVIVNMSQFMQFFFNIGVSLRGSEAEKVRRAWSMPTTLDLYIWSGNQQAWATTYSTPSGWRLVLFTLRGIIVLSGLDWEERMPICLRVGRCRTRSDEREMKGGEEGGGGRFLGIKISAILTGTLVDICRYRPVHNHSV